MPWCHECEQEYINDVKICPECGSELFEELPPSMMKPEKLKWGYNKNTEKSAEWPKDEQGNNIPSVFLTNVSGSQLDYEMTLSLLRAFEIPYVCDFSAIGRLAKICLGFSGTGMDIHVPETMLEDARDVLVNNSDE